MTLNSLIEETLHGNFQNEPSLIEELRRFYKIQQDENGLPVKLKVEAASLNKLIDLTHYLIDNRRDTSALIECFRSLRNVCFKDEGVQMYVVRNKLLMAKVKYMLSLKLDDTLLKCILLFLTNSVVNNTITAYRVWMLFNEELIILFCKGILLYNTSALIYNIYCNNHDIKLEFDLAQKILELISSEHENDEYLTFLFEHFMKDADFLIFYAHYSVDARVCLLAELKDRVLKTGNDVLSVQFIQTLIIEFKRKSDAILKTVDCGFLEKEPVEVSLALEILAGASSNEKYKGQIQMDKSLLINCTFLLSTMHDVGKRSENNFSAIERLSEMSKEHNSKYEEHPAFGFKANLIRLIGNMADECKDNQDELRELDCIPLLLDCCKIDVRNPLIMQWTILAIRNVTRNNLENQKIIAQMTRQGIIDSATLNELGLTLDEENKIGIVPLR